MFSSGDFLSFTFLKCADISPKPLGTPVLVKVVRFEIFPVAVDCRANIKE